VAPHAIGRGGLTRLAHDTAQLVTGFCFVSNARVRALAGAAGASLLYPGPDAIPAARLRGSAPPVLFVVDGTWRQAEKMLAANPRLALLRRVSFGPTPPSGYRDLRREPEPHCLSTLEAVATALAELEGGAARFQPMRDAFARSVELQFECSRGDRRRPRHRRPRT
jgi:DTW domain-containing protein YfiP